MDHRNPMDGRDDIRVLQSVVNRLVKETSKIPTVIVQSIPVGFDHYLRQTIEGRE